MLARIRFGEIKMATSISKARDALLQLGRSADPKTKTHLNTISSALETLGKRLTAIENTLKKDNLNVIAVHKSAD